MLRRIACLVPLLAVLALASGCVVNRVSASLAPDTELGRFKSFYVVKAPKDEHAIDKLISDNLQKRGFRVTGGAQPTSPPAGVDTLVTYTDNWAWDITMYLLELTINFRDPKTDFSMAKGNSYHTSLNRLSPPEMVNEVLTNIFTTKDRK
jgi:hypothetical protein